MFNPIENDFTCTSARATGTTLRYTLGVSDRGRRAEGTANLEELLWFAVVNWQTFPHDAICQSCSKSYGHPDHDLVKVWYAATVCYDVKNWRIKLLKLRRFHKRIRL
jgi:hypothetical protein